MKTDKPNFDPEIAALKRILKLLTEMDGPTRERVLTYLVRRYLTELPR